MSNFPSTAQEFYRLRDDRTNRCADVGEYQDIRCSVHLSEALAATAVGQAMFISACNLLSRWCRQIRLVLPRAQLHPAFGLGVGDVGDFVLEQMHDANPFGDFQISADYASAQVTLSIGKNAIAISNRPAVFINASGWHASVSRHTVHSFDRTDDDNMLGAIAASCLGVAQVFKIAIHVPSERLIRDGVFDLFCLDWSSNHHHAPWPTDMDAGRVLMIGAGSVGSSAAYCMRLAGLSGAITIVDNDEVKVENLNRSPIFGRKTIDLSKPEAIGRFLSDSRLVTTVVPLLWNEFLQERGRLSMDFDVWLPLANEFGVRPSIQNNVPPLMIHASTGANWGVYHGRHIPGRDDCLSDRFPADMPTNTLVCSTGEVETPKGSVDAALPFASLFAGLLIVADLTRGNMPGYPQVPNFAHLDWYAALEIQQWNKLPRSGCICRHQGLTLHDRFNANTKHRHLFQFP